MGKLGHFLSYNNAVPIAVAFMLMGAGGVFAATNPEAIYAEDQTTVAVDNTYIANKYLDAYTPQIEISGVTEDVEYYFVAFEFTTIDVDNAVWRDVVKTDTLKVAKSALGESLDLGLYATEQFKQLIGHELERLRETQAAARRAVSTKMVATAYTGLVGQFLDTTTEELPGYVPVVMPLPEDVPVLENPPAEGEIPVTPPNEPQPSEPESGVFLQLLGDNPARVPVGKGYNDLGVVINVEHEPFTLTYFLNDDEVSHVSINTATSGEWRVRYRVTDAEGTAATVERTVIVFAEQSAPPAQPPASPPSTTTPTSTPPAGSDPEPIVSTSTEEETPPPAPEPEPEPEEEPAEESAPENPQDAPSE